MEMRLLPAALPEGLSTVLRALTMRGDRRRVRRRECVTHGRGYGGLLEHLLEVVGLIGAWCDVLDWLGSAA